MEWMTKKCISIYTTGQLSQVDFYTTQVLRYEFGTHYGHIIIVQSYYYKTKFGIILLKYQFLYTLLITMQSWYLSWQLDNKEEINTTKF